MKYTQYFEVSNGVLHTVKDCPRHVEDLVYNIHSRLDAIANTWIYCEIYNAFEELQRDNLDDINIDSDSYNSELYKWFGEPFAYGMIQEYMEEFNPSAKNIYELIGASQWYTRKIIYEMVNDFMEEHKNDEEEE